VTIIGLTPPPLKVTCGPYERSRCYIKTVEDTTVYNNYTGFLLIKTNHFCQQATTADIFFFPTGQIYQHAF
jgi:hypothetical protein